MANVVVRPSVLEPTKIIHFDEGEHAGFRINGSEFRFHYEDALKFSQLLRVHAKKAKKRAGDESRHWSAIAVLDHPKV